MIPIRVLDADAFGAFAVVEEAGREIVLRPHNETVPGLRDSVDKADLGEVRRLAQGAR